MCWIENYRWADTVHQNSPGNAHASTCIHNCNVCNVLQSRRNSRSVHLLMASQVRLTLGGKFPQTMLEQGQGGWGDPSVNTSKEGHVDRDNYNVRSTSCW